MRGGRRTRRSSALVQLRDIKCLTKHFSPLHRLESGASEEEDKSLVYEMDM